MRSSPPMADATLLDLSPDALEARLAALGHPAYRARQIAVAVFRQLVSSYDEITTLPAELRHELAARLPFTPCEPMDSVQTADGATRKTLYRLQDGETIETVVMEYPDRFTVCVSSQVGCAVACPFCASGRGGWVRDLTPGEIVSQVLHAARAAAAVGRRLTNVVYMGMGEPLANYESVLASLRIENDPRALGLGARSFTLSTAGDAPGILRLAAEPLQVNLAVSLHAGDDALRSALIPLNRHYPLDELLRACHSYVEITHRRVTFEIALIDGMNDDRRCAAAVAARLRGLLCHVNLIPWNPIPQLEWRRSRAAAVEAYEKTLSDVGIPTTVRDSRGVEIEAGCGQLRARPATR
ncbi:MAG: 23S rRNA (adenine(2503)-C(2))-methyltransferase RlmN [Candidatus Bipolaricaulis sp.]|nr:23S rRNA (adenine(2503)-C(2))-methyltransferase RlmN [Candidatus Bipolaricaulis sp.]